MLKVLCHVIYMQSNLEQERGTPVGGLTREAQAKI